jgi:hypothetical protein
LICGWVVITVGAGLALSGVAPHAVRPVLVTTAFIVCLGALAAGLLSLGTL